MLTADRSLKRSDQSGFTLVELVIVVFLLGVVGAIVGVSMVRGLQAESRAQERIEASEEMQIALERMSREIRAARVPLAEAEPGAITLDVLRDGGCVRFRFWVQDEDLWGSEERSTADCDHSDTAAERVLVRNLDEHTVFEYLTSSLEDAGANPAAVRIALTRELQGQGPVSLSTTVGLRNAD